jgi:hypothetical protein
MKHSIYIMTFNITPLSIITMSKFTLIISITTFNIVTLSILTLYK